VVLAQEEARTLAHNYIGTEHILLGLLREDEGLAARVLESFGLTVERVRQEIVRTVGAGTEGVTPGQIPFTPRAKRVIELGLREAQALGNNFIGTEHLLLGLVRENEGVAARIMLVFDADPERVRNEVNRMLGGPRPSPRGERPRRIGHSVQVNVLPRPALDWNRANLLWRPEGLELRIPLHLGEGAIAKLAADEVWASPLLAGLRREIWNGWLALASDSLLEEIDPIELRAALDAAAKRALDVSGREQGRVEDFLRRLREGA
jgi:hypothetical protein